MYTKTGYITLRLYKLNASRTTGIKHKNHAENSKHGCKTYPWKKCQRKDDAVHKNYTLVTNTIKDRLQNMYSCPQMSQRKSSIISSNSNTRKKPTLDSDQKTGKMF